MTIIWPSYLEYEQVTLKNAGVMVVLEQRPFIQDKKLKIVSTKQTQYFKVFHYIGAKQTILPALFNR
jgi:spermidine synthase